MVRLADDLVFEAFHKVASAVNRFVAIQLRKPRQVYTKTNALGGVETVTDLDLGIMGVCITVLSDALPDIPVFCEEDFDGDETVLDAEYVLILDPVDGTAELIRNNQFWTVSLALAVRSRMVASMLLSPERDLLLFVANRTPVLFNGSPMVGDSIPLSRRIAVSPRQAFLPCFRESIKRTEMEPLPIPTLTAKIISLLFGQADAAVYFPQENTSANVWDYAAASLLLERTGGLITSLDGLMLPFHGPGIIHRKGWLATRTGVSHSALLHAITKGAFQ